MEHQPNLIAYRDFEIYLEQTSSADELAADAARKTLLEDRRTLEFMKRVRSLPPKRFDELATNNPYLERCTWIMKKYDKGGKKAEEANQEVENLPMDVYAGFLIFRKKYYEVKFGVNLISTYED